MTSPDKRDYYEVLGIARDAGKKAIRDAFRNLALKYHPDRNKEPNAEERFKEIAEAYAVLSDPRKRAEYDTRGFPGIADFSQEDLYSGINFDNILSGLDFGMGGLFDNFFHRHREGAARGENIEIKLVIPLSRVATGGPEEIRLERPISCPACHGTGCEGGAKPESCPTCNGTGRLITHRHQEAVEIQHISVCPACHGKGSLIRHPCHACQGGGEVDSKETLTVEIPKGIEEGMALRIPGKGMPGQTPKSAAGDLLIVVHTRHDPRFEREGADLVRQETIPLTDAVLGKTLEVPTLDNSVSVTIPPGTQPYSMLRVKGKGLPEFGDERCGDLYLRITVRLPEKLTGEERKLYERLRTIGEQSHVSML
jgi:molecular chaperone DnaJ